MAGERNDPSLTWRSALSANGGCSPIGNVEPASTAATEAWCCHRFRGLSNTWLSCLLNSSRIVERHGLPFRVLVPLKRLLYETHRRR